MNYLTVKRWPHLQKLSKHPTVKTLILLSFQSVWRKPSSTCIVIHCSKPMWSAWLRDNEKDLGFLNHFFLRLCILYAYWKKPAFISSSSPSDSQRTVKKYSQEDCLLWWARQHNVFCILIKETKIFSWDMRHHSPETRIPNNGLYFLWRQSLHSCCRFSSLHCLKN